jgi:hypothetical protein
MPFDMANTVANGGDAQVTGRRNVRADPRTSADGDAPLRGASS